MGGGGELSELFVLLLVGQWVAYMNTTLGIITHVGSLVESDKIERVSRFESTDWSGNKLAVNKYLLVTED